MNPLSHTPIPELAVVAITRDSASHGLVRGDRGTVVHVHPDAVAYIVEFIDDKGETRCLATLEAGLLQTLEAAEAAGIPTQRIRIPDDAAASA